MKYVLSAIIFAMSVFSVRAFAAPDLCAVAGASTSILVYQINIMDLSHVPKDRVEIAKQDAFMNGFNKVLQHISTLPAKDQVIVLKYVIQEYEAGLVGVADTSMRSFNAAQTCYAAHGK